MKERKFDHDVLDDLDGEIQILINLINLITG